MPAFNSRDYIEAMAKANKHGGMLYPVRLTCVLDLWAFARRSDD